MSFLLKGVLQSPVAEIAACLPQLERVMVIGSENGTTHERLGRIETVTPEGDWICLAGAAHASRFDPAQVARVTFDRSSGMKDKILPKLVFRDPEDQVIFQVVSLSGLEEFDAVFAAHFEQSLPAEEARPTSEGQAPKPAAEVPPLSETDPAWRLLAEVQNSEETVTLRFTRPGFFQDWQGSIAAIKPAMGFINVMTPDFHLHLKGGSVTDWQSEGDVFAARDLEGRLTGLSLHRAQASGQH